MNDVQNDSKVRPANFGAIEGFTSASARTSLTNAQGALRLDPIDGVRYRLARPVSHHHGHLTEAFRMDWRITDAPVVQVNVTVTFPGRIRAWGIHRLTVDRLFAATGSLLHCPVTMGGVTRRPSVASMNSCSVNEIRVWSSFRPAFITAGRILATTRPRSSACQANNTNTKIRIAGSCRGILRRLAR